MTFNYHEAMREEQAHLKQDEGTLKDVMTREEKDSLLKVGRRQHPGLDSATRFGFWLLVLLVVFLAGVETGRRHEREQKFTISSDANGNLEFKPWPR